MAIYSRGPFLRYAAERKGSQSVSHKKGDDQMNAHFRVAFTSVVIMMLGMQAGLAFDHLGIGILLGVVVGVPYAIARMGDGMKGFVLVALVIQIGLAFVAGGVVALLLALLLTCLVFLAATLPLRDLYGGSEMETLAHHLRMMAGASRGYQLVQNGEIVIPDDGLAKDGPCYTLIGPGSAASFVCGAQETRISGPGTFWTVPWERMQRVYDLSPRQESLTYDEVLTRDLLPTRVEIDVIYGMDICEAARRGEQPLDEREVGILRRIDANMHQWESTTRSAIERGVRLALGQKSLIELLSVSDFESLERHILTSANHKLRVWDIRLNTVILRDIQPKVRPAGNDISQRRAV
jgi:hypothetical protein